MSFGEIIDIIKNLNLGSIIYNTPDVDTFIDLKKEKSQLYISKEQKYYYISEYQGISSSRNLGRIEKEIAFVDNTINIRNKPRPRDSYLILLYALDDVNEDILKEVISIEENEYLYKKYVFYYTKTELEAFVTWYKDKESKGIISINQFIGDYETSLELNDINKDYIKFLLRLIIKFPFINITFKSLEFKNYEMYVNKEIAGIRERSDEILSLNERIKHTIETSNNDIELAAETLLKQTLGDELYEL